MIKDKIIRVGSQYSAEDLQNLRDEYTLMGFDTTLDSETLRVHCLPKPKEEKRTKDDRRK